MKIINKISERNKHTWIEVKEIHTIMLPQNKHTYFTLGFNDYDDDEYTVNFDPYEFINTVDTKTLNSLKTYIINKLKKI
tara:strand:+ start:1348 stop:1584 length:237 start_codon:yes stop_codon:yes gene_type:complete